CGTRGVWIGCRGRVCVAVEAVLARVVASLDLDQPDFEPGVALGVEPEGAGYVDRPDRLLRGGIVSHRGPRAYLYPRPRTGHAAAVPRLGPGPRAAPRRANERAGARAGRRFRLVAPRNGGPGQHADQAGHDRVHQGSRHRWYSPWAVTV